jgi:ElaB/YqjD/DUF883 family membrane-anchored ribosome-binding protein
MAERTNLATQRRADETEERSAHEIRQDIAAKRETISETVDKLGERIHDTFDWRVYIADYPMVALGLAAGVGFLISGIFKRNPTPQERIMDALAEMTEDLTDRVSGVASDVIKKKMISGISGKTVKAAVTATVTKAALDFAKKKARSLMDGKSEPENEQTFMREREGLDTNIQTSHSSTSSY